LCTVCSEKEAGDVFKFDCVSYECMSVNVSSGLFEIRKVTEKKTTIEREERRITAHIYE
jgi:hypothetical protein